MKNVRLCAGIGFAFCGLLATPVSAYRWPGEHAVIGSALSAKVIGQSCKGFLSAAEIAELDAYIVRIAAELTAKRAKDDQFSQDKFIRDLSADYAKIYRDPNACNSSAAEEARDTLDKVRRDIASGKPLVWY